MFEINARTILSTMGVRFPVAWLQAQGLGRSFSTNVVHGKFERLDFKRFEQLCRILKCTPDQIIVYRPKANEVFNENHPFYKLRYTPPLKFPAHLLHNRTANELQELYDKMLEWDAEKNKQQPQGPNRS